MTERIHAIPCPVCLGIMLMRHRLGSPPQLEVDRCRRCGGLWLDHGEVQRLRSLDPHRVRVNIDNLSTPAPAHCHDCHVPIGRDADSCASCGASNRLHCPVCDTTMDIMMRHGLRLDICRGCKGVWFDHHEIAAIWGPRLDAALRQRGAPAADDISAAEIAGDTLFHMALFAPDILHDGASAAGAIVAELPEAIAASPEMAAVVVEAVAEVASSVIETVVEIVSGVLG